MTGVQTCALPICPIVDEESGFRGRRAIAELLVPNRTIDKLIFEGADDMTIERAAVEQGMRPIFDSGLSAVIEGDTTIEEVVRCIRSEA